MLTICRPTLSQDSETRRLTDGLRADVRTEREPRSVTPQFYSLGHVRTGQQVQTEYIEYIEDARAPSVVSIKPTMDTYYV